MTGQTNDVQNETAYVTRKRRVFDGSLKSAYSIRIVPKNAAPAYQQDFLNATEPFYRRPQRTIIPCD